MIYKTKTKCIKINAYHRCYRRITAPNMRQNSPIKYLLLDRCSVASPRKKGRKAKENIGDRFKRVDSWF